MGEMNEGMYLCIYSKASKNATNETANTTKDDSVMWVADSWQWHKLCNTSATTAQPAVP